MTRLEIFDEVVDIMKCDSSTCKDIAGGNVVFYRKQVKEEMSDTEFLYIMQAYLATFGIKGHINFYKTDSNSSIDFKVQRYRDVLYVIDVAKNSKLKRGDKIIEVDGVSIREFATKHEAFMYGETEERQSYGWHRLLKFCNEVTLEEENGTLRSMPIDLNAEWEEKEKYFCKALENQTVYMRLADFDEEENIQKM